MDFNKPQPKFAAKPVGNESSAKKPPTGTQRPAKAGTPGRASIFD